MLSYFTILDHITTYLCSIESNNLKQQFFNITPYMVKEKASLIACMRILDKSRKEIIICPSKASDLEINPRERLMKHFLAKVINKLNAFIELLDYQVAAYFLNMPLIESSENFQYCETYATINYRQFLIE